MDVALLITTTSWNHINVAWLFLNHVVLFKESDQTYLEGYNLLNSLPGMSKSSSLLSTGSM